MMHQAKQDVILKHTKWIQVILARVKKFEASIKLMTKFSQVEKFASHPKINWAIDPEILVDKFGTDVVISIDNVADEIFNIGQNNKHKKKRYKLEYFIIILEYLVLLLNKHTGLGEKSPSLFN